MGAKRFPKFTGRLASAKFLHPRPPSLPPPDIHKPLGSLQKTMSSDSEEQIVLAPPLAELSSLLDTKPEALATGDKEIQLAALQAAKFIFDSALQTESRSRAQLLELLSSISPAAAPQTRSQTAAANGKRKRDPSPPLSAPTYLGPRPQETPLSELSIEGMDEEQIWAQLELRAGNVCEILEYALETTGPTPESDEEDGQARKGKGLRIEEDGDVDMDGMDDMEDSEEDDDEEDDEEREVEDEEEDTDDGMEDEDLGEGVADLRDPSDDEPSSDIDLDKPSILSGGKRTIRIKPRRGGHPVLDDGFFDLAAFNAETEEAEARAVSKGRLGRDSDDEDEDAVDEEVDYFAPVDGVQAEEEMETQELYYKDFFEAPAKIPSKANKKDAKPALTGKVRFHEQVRVKNIKPKGKNLPLSSMFIEEDDEDEDDDDEEYDGEEDEDDSDEDDDDDESGDADGMEVDEEGFGGFDDEEDEDDDGEKDESSDQAEEEGGLQTRTTMDRFKDDLFADDDEQDESEQGLTAFQKRMAALKEEISSLESENVAKKHWTLMGEASSRSRPQNALLEEDLDFERVMKTVPVITEETVQGLEALIKSRIIDNRFDDVVRRREEDDKPFLPSRFFELQDTKSKQSLAEIYQDEYTAAQTGGIAGEDRDGKLKKEHDELEKIWDGICYKLDALSNAHFTPKAPKATISTVANVSAATLESALPTTKATSTMLAPEEVFAPSPSDLRARSELTPEEKRALHNKQKKAKRKNREKLDDAVDKYAKVKGVKKQKEVALKSVVKVGKGVTVIGKEGVATKKKKS
ncbi:Mpp10 protein [Cristinia sonorae]|uniref:Mpp10 protein n=1 Tax=Cristinia sonorae TaxID=1940300 RepID=A0A8K0USX5_9AGAR|nr:Mpp10 protein [Cristinia sonorae]